LCVFALLMPGPVKRVILRRALGWTIAPSATIGLSLFANVVDVRLGEGARIGHFNVFRNLRTLDLGPRAAIGQWNWVTASDVLLLHHGSAATGVLLVAHDSAITSRHYLDCSGGITVGAFTIVAGVRSTLLSHQIDLDVSKQTVRPIRIGDYCFISSNARLTPGSTLVDRCVVAMGAVVVGELAESRTLYAGVPAQPIKTLGDAAFFERLNKFGGDAAWFDPAADGRD